ADPDATRAGTGEAHRVPGLGRVEGRRRGTCLRQGRAAGSARPVLDGADSGEADHGVTRSGCRGATVSSSVIGVDLGGTKIAVASLRGNRLSDSHLEPTCLGSGAELIEQIVSLVDSARDQDLAAIGVGVPSVVEFETGRVVSSVNVPLAEVPLRQVLGERTGVPVFVDNDATVAGLAEAHDEDLNLVAHDLVIVTVGTGLGGGLV